MFSKLKLNQDFREKVKFLKISNTIMQIVRLNGELKVKVT